MKLSFNITSSTLLLIIILLATPVQASFNNIDPSADCTNADDRATLEISESECLALEALWNATTANGAWTTTTSWGTVTSANTWHGVTASAAEGVTSLDLSNNSLDGTIPDNIGNLIHLTSLVLSDNSLSNAIPNNIGNLTNLTILDLYKNQLTGSIPPELGNLSSLTRLYLDENLLSGAIPAQLGDLSNLTRLWLNNNQLSGDIPASLGTINTLVELKLNNNNLSGVVPTSLGRGIGDSNKDLAKLILNNNQLSGTIPVSLGYLYDLVELRLDYNQLTGEIPASLGNLPDLEILYLCNNQLSGNIPSSIGNLQKLTILHLDVNALSGSLPVDLVNFSDLVDLSIFNNQLSGNIPNLSQIASLATLSFENNNFVFDNFESEHASYDDGSPATYTFAPQADIDVVRTVNVRTGGILSITPSIEINANNSYQWAKNGAPINDATSRIFEENAADDTDGGVYTYTVNNSIVTGLTLESENITVTVTSNSSPEITSNGGGDQASIDAAENQTNVTIVTATDPEAGDTLTYSIIGGVDQALFSINSSTGELIFLAAPDFENPTDAGSNNEYEVQVAVSDGILADSQSLSIAITNTDDNNPIINEVVSVATPTTDDTPNYTFSSTKAGVITYGGSCSSTTVNATSGSNTITFTQLTNGTYTNCTIMVTDTAGNMSNLLNVTVFQINTNLDTTSPIISEITPVSTPTSNSKPSYTFSSTEGGTISYGGHCTSVTTSAITGTNTITFNSLVDGRYADCSITVTNTTGNNSNVLNISAFVINTSSDITVPIVREIIPIIPIVSDSTPSYTFSSTEDGVISYGGSCNSTTTHATAGNNTITFEPLDTGLYSNCTIMVTDGANNQSIRLSVSKFEVIESEAIITPIHYLLLNGNSEL